MTHDGIDAWTDLNEQPGTEPHEHRADQVRVTTATPEGHLRRTGVTLLETCQCGATRSVWVTSFKVDPAAWQEPERVEEEDPYANDWKPR
jgi:hypothetical protein